MRRFPATSDLARIGDEAHVLNRHRVEKGLDRGPRRDLVARVDDRERGNADASGPDRRASHWEGSATEAVFAIEPLKDLVDEPPGEGKLVQRPALDPSMQRQCPRVADAQSGIDQPRS